MTVIVGYTPGAAGLHVVRTAAREAQLRGLPLLVVNSGTGAAYADRGLATPEELTQLQAEAATPGLDVQVKQVTDAVSVDDTLVEEATQLQAELLVIGLRHRSRTGKFLMGSNAQNVLLRSPCDVLAVRIDHL